MGHTTWKVGLLGALGLCCAGGALALYYLAQPAPSRFPAAKAWRCTVADLYTCGPAVESHCTSVPFHERNGISVTLLPFGASRDPAGTWMRLCAKERCTEWDLKGEPVSSYVPDTVALRLPESSPHIALLHFRHADWRFTLVTDTPPLEEGDMNMLFGSCAPGK